MTIRILAILTLLGFVGSANAFRILGQPERPFELSLSQVTLPKDTAGSVTLRECDKCGISTRRLADGAKFVVDGHEGKYVDFLQIVADLRANSRLRDATVVTVIVDVVTERVNRIEISRPRH